MTTPTFKSRFIYHLPDYWTTEQALAVLELLDDLREVIWSHYDLKVIDQVHAYLTHPAGVPVWMKKSTSPILANRSAPLLMTVPSRGAHATSSENHE